jgi:hypothetical protein
MTTLVPHEYGPAATGSSTQLTRSVSVVVAVTGEPAA